MMKCKKRVLTLLLALCMLLSLAACGSKNAEDDTRQLSATVYVPEFLSLDLDILGKNYNLSGGCTDGTNVYLLAYVYPDYEAGEEGDSRTLLIRFPLDGGEPTEMKSFQSGSTEEDGTEVHRNFNSLRTGIDGSLWLEESTYSYVFDLPKDFDEETDSKYNYTTDTVRKEYQVQLDSTGTEITRIDTSDLQEKAGVEGRYQNGLLVDKDGDIFITDSQKIVVLDSSMNVRFTVEDSNMRGGSLVELSERLVVEPVPSSETTVWVLSEAVPSCRVPPGAAEGSVAASTPGFSSHLSVWSACSVGAGVKSLSGSRVRSQAPASAAMQRADRPQMARVLFASVGLLFFFIR